MKKAAGLLIFLLLGGCITDRPDLSASGMTASERAKYEQRQRCQSTSMGSQPQTVCY